MSAWVYGILRNRNVAAWLLLAFAIAVHVFDEAINGFLPFYNAMVTTLQGSLGFFPAPTFTFDVWLGGLSIGIILCVAATPFVRRGGDRMRLIAISLGVLMVFNALGHLVGSLYFWKALPGMWSSPMLLFSAGWVIIRGRPSNWSQYSGESDGCT